MTIHDYEGGIHKDTHILGDNVYAGNGQGCRTVWYPSVAQARKIIRHLGYVPDGTMAGLCQRCACHYSVTDPQYSQYPGFACDAWKRAIAVEVGIWIKSGNWIAEVNNVPIPK